ncbi:MAG: (deoxy)nucleoside triphosphate pyrophosphohydrolase [Lactobacillales bacterium]|jgi:8-oxo-dGTP diphosphatase|nr:(deoxy)nucleoside triphosphate pyrophosphohydrolase [Lactobacillales bacterium]
MIQIAMALLVHNSKILIAQRNPLKDQGGLWEFPGGKQEPNETLPECLAREFMEEFAKEIHPHDLFFEHEYTYEGKGDFHFSTFWATCRDETIPELNDHINYKWVSIPEMRAYQFCPADLPVIAQLEKLT